MHIGSLPVEVLGLISEFVIAGVLEDLQNGEYAYDDDDEVDEAEEEDDDDDDNNGREKDEEEDLKKFTPSRKVRFPQQRCMA